MMDTTSISADGLDSTIPILSEIAPLGQRYPAWLVDIWGVMHNGLSAYQEAVAATKVFRARGGAVVLLSNSPRPSEAVQAQLRELGVSDDAYDTTVTSGDLTRHELSRRPGLKVLHIGPERDRPIFNGLDVTLVEAAQAELVVCSGLYNDEAETPADYNDLLEDLATRSVPMLCANPDHMVERGSRLIYCAGALADLFEDFGGNPVYAGKPYRPVYDLAFERLSEIMGREVAAEEVLAIGDGVNTDMAGAAQFGLDAVFIAGGLHASDLKTIGSKKRGAKADNAAQQNASEAELDHLDGAALATFFGRRKRPVAAMHLLA